MSHACKYDDSALTERVDDLEGRIEKLEELCRQMNTNISSLQTIVTALQSNDYVTGVTPILEEGTEIGYTITFGQNNPITIYHGQKGETGAIGNDGHTPTIGVALDTDGNYYWTLDGNWLTDDVGNKIKAQGESGAQGITPQLKIENGYWYVSYDNQQTWVSVGPATSEGESGDSMFERVTQDDENVYFTLIGGETITLPKASSLAIQFEEGTSLQFNNIGEEKTIHYTITGGNAPLITVSMQDNNNCCSLELTETSATTGTIHIRAIAEAKSRIIVSIFDNDHSIAAAIDITISVPFDGQTVTVLTPGTLDAILSSYDQEAITALTVIGPLNTTDIQCINRLPNLSILDLEQANIKEIPDEAFSENKTLTSIKLPQTLEIIGTDAFGMSQIGGSLVIPDNVTTIQSLAFYYCSKLTNLTLPNGITTIGESAFGYCSGLTELSIPSSVTVIEESAFSYCFGLTKLTIPSSVTVIGKSAFSCCSGLTELTIPSSVTEIGESAFSYCSSLSSLTLSEGVNIIGKDAFSYCSELTELTIPASVTTIGNYAFYDCNKIDKIYCKSQTPPQVGSNWISLPSSCTLYVPTGCAEAYRTAPGWSTLSFQEIIEIRF